MSGLQTGGCQIRALARESYTREPKVTEAIQNLLRMDESGRCRRLRNAGNASPDSIPIECLVYFVREALLRRDVDEAWALIEVIQARCTPHIREKVRRIGGLTEDERAEFYDDLITDCYLDWLSLEPGAAFWEARFWLCLNRKLQDAWKRRRGVPEVNFSEMVGSSDDRDPLETIADTSAVNPEAYAAAKMALGSLPDPIRAVYYLFHVEGIRQTDIAKSYGVDERTIRNWLKRGAMLLKPWLDGDL